MTCRKKTWQEKMADKEGLPKILRLRKNFPCYGALAKVGAKPGDKVVLTNPKDVEAIMKRVPRGKLITMHELCKKLAKRFRVDACCTLTTGIFVMIAANAAEEMKSQGKKNSNPYWRTLKAGGFLNEKYPGGVEAHKKLLEDEGYAVTQRGRRYQVRDFEKYLVRA